MAPSVARWLELVMLGGDPWILPIWTAANEAARAGTVPPLTDELGQLGLHISIRLDILPRVARRITQETSEVYRGARGHAPEHVFTRATQGYAFPVDDGLKYRLIADIDALYSRSTLAGSSCGSSSSSSAATLAARLLEAETL